LPAEIGRYRIERLIGSGAMGMIYAAHDPVIDRKVAIKLIRADLLSGDDKADYVARFQREARSAGRCTHPNIVAVYDFAVHEGNPFLAMEYIEAANLSQTLASSGRFTAPAAVAVAAQVLDALACAHGLGIVHRDVKPANVLLLANGQVKMTDFGIARMESADRTLVEAVIGTPSYMSPEQFRGEAVDARSDLFSAGVVLYEMLVGERPFPGRNITEIAYRLLSDEPMDIRAKVATLPASLASIVERALAKRPEDRFASAAEMAMALRQAEPRAEADDLTVVHRLAPALTGTFAEATLSTIERKLAQHLGPIARHLVQSAALRAVSLDDLCETLGQQIERPEQRAQFRHDILQSRTDASSSERATTAGKSPLPPVRQAVIGTDELRRAEQELVRYVGPIARILVKRAAGAARSSDEFWQLLATHIGGETDRQAFLRGRT
jgi:serine/threonine protein kinase